MPKRLPKHCVEDVDRYGTVRVYLRRKGLKKVKLEGVPWSEPFMEAYRAAIEGTPDPVRDPRKTVADTWKWLCQQHLASTEFKRLDPVTQRRRRSLLEATYDEVTAPDAKTIFADVPLSRMTPAAIRVLRDRKAAKPDGANNRLKAIRGVYKWAMRPEIGAAPHNPARDVPLISTKSDGFHTWSIAEVQQFQARHPLGTRQHLALSLLLYVGGRRSDIVNLGRQHLRDGWIKYTQHKNRNNGAMTLEVPVLAPLQEAMDACPNMHLTFLVTGQGRPFSSNGFGNLFKDWCREAGLPHCSAHGLRKAGATIAAENGATVHQLMAMFGWKTAKMAEHYTRTAEQKRLARQGMPYLTLDRESENDSVQLSKASGAKLDFSGKNRGVSMPYVSIGAQERIGHTKKLFEQNQSLNSAGYRACVTSCVPPWEGSAARRMIWSSEVCEAEDGRDLFSRHRPRPLSTRAAFNRI